MKKKARKAIVIILFLLIGFIIIVSESTLPSATTDYYITTADLNVRTGAGTKHSISFTIRKGDEVEILSKENNWYKIKHLERIGYAYSKYLRHSRTVSNTSEPDTNTRYQIFQQTITHIAIGVFSLIIFFVFFIIFRKIRNKKLLKTVTKPNRGTSTERDLVLKLLKYGIPAPAIFHDLYLKKHNSFDFSQIDLAIVTKVGIIVFEVKDYSGWIFGTGYKEQWTKVLAYGKQKYRFYNPIMQNNKHIENLRKSLKQFDNVPFYSIVVFYGECVLKDVNFVPNGTFLVKPNRVLDVVKIIMKNNELYQYTNKNEILRVLREAVENGDDTKNQIQHINNVMDRLGKDRIFE